MTNGMDRRRFITALGGVAAGATLLASAPSRAQQLTQVRFGSINVTSDAGIFIADEWGFFKDEGIELVTNTIDNAPALIAAIATNQLDVGGISVTPGLFAAVDQGINLRVVGDKQSFSKGFGSTKLVIRKEAVKGSEKETVEGLRGKTVAINSKGAITSYFMESLLNKYGLTVNDVRMTEIGYGSIATALMDGRIEAGSLIEPFVTRVIASGSGALLGGDLLEFVPGGEMSVTPLIYSEGFRQKKDAAMAFMRAYMRGVRAYNDAFRKGVRKDEVIQIIATRTRSKPEIIRDGFLPGLDPNQHVNADAFVVVEKYYAKKGLIRNPKGNVDGLVDMSFAEAAVKALGEYKL